MEQGGVNTVPVVPATRPKAKAAPVAVATVQPEEESKAWPVEEEAYRPPERPRVYLAGQLDALEERAEQLREGDPRRIVAQKRIQEVQEALKDAGGKTLVKLHFTLLDGQKELSKRGKEREAAKEALEVARRTTAQVLEAEARAEALVRACAAKEENTRLRNAHLAFQLAVEATVGVEGYKELEEKLYYLGAKLAVDDDRYAREALESIAWFVGKFAPQTYSKDHDPYIKELASSDSDATVDVARCGARSGLGGVEAGVAHGATEAPAQARPPMAFDTPIAAAEAARLAAKVEEGITLPAAFRSTTGREEPERKKATSAKRATEGRKARSEERLVQAKVCKKSARSRAASVARPKGGKGESERGGEGKEMEQGARSNPTTTGSRGRSLARAASARSGSRTPRIEGASVLSAASGATGGKGRGGVEERAGSRFGDERRGGEAGNSMEGKRRKREGDINMEECPQWGDYCLGCGNGPLHPSLLTGRCVCGGPVCQGCCGANACMRCNNGGGAEVGRKMLC